MALPPAIDPRRRRHRGLPPSPVPPPEPPADPEYWNPDDKDSDIALSNSDRTATWSGSGAIRSKTSHAAGKYYAELTRTAFNAGFTNFGIGDGDADITAQLGSDAHGYGKFHNSGSIFHNNNLEAYGGGFGTNDVVGVAADLTSGRLYFSVNGAWQGGGDPAANTGGFPIDLEGPVFLMASSTAGLTVVNLETDPENFEHTIPAGFQAWR
jgi:hypothetical protein